MDITDIDWLYANLDIMMHWWAEKTNYWISIFITIFEASQMVG